MEIYLDNSATTKPSIAAINAAVKAAQDSYGNPSSLHAKGNEAAKLLLTSRNELLCSLWGQSIRSKLPRTPGMRGGEEYGKIIFTASGTEANNLAINGLVASTKISHPEIITTDSEHPSILEPLSQLESSGIKVHKLSTNSGVINIDELKSYLNPNTALVSIMHLNNETGAIYDLSTIFSTVKKHCPNAVCHTDCVQSFQKVPFTPASLNADILSISAHKVHGFKGVGALWVSNDLISKKRPLPIILGGGQEDAFRSGTENIPGIAAFSAAVADNGSDNAASFFIEKTQSLSNLLIENLPAGVILNRPKLYSSPHILSLTLPIPKSQPMLNYLSGLGIYVSSGSACSSHKNTVSHVLTAFGLKKSEADSTIRVSIDPTNTEDEIIEFCSALKNGISKLGKQKKERY